MIGLSTGIEWRIDPDPADWDSALAALGGHPLQSALWGNARRHVDGICDHRLMALRAGSPLYMIRFEERRVPLLGRVAWAPRGPTEEAPGGADEIPAAVRASLKGSGIALLITDPWRRADREGMQPTTQRSLPRTIWIDVGGGKEQVWNSLDSRFRQGFRRGQRSGLTVKTTRSPQDIKEFFALCDDISQVKGFRLPASLALMQHLLRQAPTSDIECQLFVARHDDQLAAGVFIIRCGRSTHFFWGGTDRESSKERAGEAVHWAAIKWAIECGCRIHDLEGIDPEGNPGVYAFKKKMGGAEITLAGKNYYSLDHRGRLLAWLDASFR